MLIAAYVLLGQIARTKVVPVSPDTESAAVRRFVQTFYDWYAPRAAGGADIEIYALRTKKELFTLRLRRALIADWRAQQKVEGVTVGLDFDPFLAGDDPPSSYSVVGVRSNGATWLATVRGRTSNEQGSGLTVIAKVERATGKYGWRFTNFIYWDGDNLLSYLERLRRDREEKPVRRQKVYSKKHRATVHQRRGSVWADITRF